MVAFKYGKCLGGLYKKIMLHNFFFSKINFLNVLNIDEKKISKSILSIRNIPNLYGTKTNLQSNLERYLLSKTGI